jgi:hypothetical protein
MNEFFESLSKLNNRLDLLESKTLQEEYLYESETQSIYFIEAHVQTNPSIDKINGLREIIERINIIINKGFDNFETFYIMPPPERQKVADKKTEEGDIISNIIEEEVLFYKSKLEGLVDKYSQKMKPILNETINKIELDLSVAHIGILIGVLYKAGILNMKILSKKKTLAFIVRYFSSKESDIIPDDMLRNKTTRVKDTELESFIDKYLNKITDSTVDFKTEKTLKRNQKKPVTQSKRGLH